MVNDFSGRPVRQVKSFPMGRDDPGLKTGPFLKVEAMLACRVAQFNSYSCSAASLTVVVNAIRRLAAGGSVMAQLSQKEVLARVDLHHWRERVSDEGYRGMHGMPLLEFGEVAEAVLDACGIGFERIDTVEIHPQTADLDTCRGRLRSALEAVAVSPLDFVVAHFTQGEYYGEWYGGHISPVGTYDPEQERVLVLDVDPECETPYWVGLDRFFEGLVGRSKVVGKPGGGYVRIELRS